MFSNKFLKYDPPPPGKEMKYTVLILVALLLHFSNCYNPYEQKTCGILYSQENFDGEKFTLLDQGQTANLPEDQRASLLGWNTTGSLNVSSSCKMELCNETYFDGACQTLDQGSYLSSFFLHGKVESVSCTCARECKCSDVFVRNSSCARAYLKGGCNTCSTLYTDLHDSQSYFPDVFVGKVEALTLRKGCTITLYSEQNWEGEEEIIDSQIVEDFKGSFNSYECDCNPEEYEPRVKPPRPPSLPLLVDIPSTLDDVIKMLSTKTYKGHPGLLASLSSVRNRRSSKNAYIMLLGSTGAGKSSAINLLFNLNVTKVGGANSTTTDIHEFRIPVPVDEIGVANSELRVIDTPGLCDTRGVEQDAKFLATLDSYLSEHEELKDRIPNVVLIFHKFSDNRFDGPGSGFVKMLRGLDSFRNRIMDENYSNVIFVLSHFASETKGIQKRPDVKLQRFKNVIENYSVFTRPTIITVAENKPNEQELFMYNGYVKLPNNEYYPKNLFEKLELVTKNGGDFMGLGVFRTAFRDSENFNISSSTFKLLQKESSKVTKYRNIIAFASLGVIKTEVSQHLQQVWDDSIGASVKTRFPFSLPYLLKSLNLLNINVKEDIPKTTIDILKLFTAIKQDEATRTLLDKGLGIRPPVFQHNTIAGYSYNVFKDMYLPFSPFKMDDLHLSEIGFMIPKVLTCKLEPGTKENFYVFNDKIEYLQNRLQSLGIEGISIDEKSFTDSIKPGHNIKTVSFRNDSCSLSATREFRRFEFILNDRLDITNEFRDRVKSLPVFNESNYETVETWNNFFNNYGTHVVKSVYGGGSIDIQLRSNKPFNHKTAEALFDLIKFAEDMTFLIGEGSEDDDNNGTIRSVLKQGTEHTLMFQGGDHQYYTSDLTKMSIEKASSLVSNWKKSLKFNPVVLTTEMRLVPMSQIVKKVGQNYSSEIERTTKLLFNSLLKPIIVKPKNNAPPTASDQTPFMMEFFKLQAEANQRMQDLMMELKNIEIENDRRRQEMNEKRLQWEQEQKQLDLEYKRNETEANRLAQDKRDEWQRKTEEARRIAEGVRLKHQQAQHEALMKAQEDAAKRQNDLMKEILNRPLPKPPRCLKPGTKILMAEMSEKSVELLEQGDMVLDMDLNPVPVLGVAHQFLGDSKFFGFDNNSFFFTNTHLFVGPTNDSGNATRIYTQSTASLYYSNPLMKYLNVSDMHRTSMEPMKLFYYNNASNMLQSKSLYVFEDSQEYPKDLPVYFIQVGSPTGTYIANGYVCRHEIPPFEHWPNTMSVLFRLVNTDPFEKLAQLPYSLETERYLDELTEKVAINMNTYIRAYTWQDKSETGVVFPVMTMADVNMEEIMLKIFSSSTGSALGERLYAKVGNVISPYLDDLNKYLDESRLAKLQNDLFNEIIKHINNTM